MRWLMYFPLDILVPCQTGSSFLHCVDPCAGAVEVKSLSGLFADVASALIVLPKEPRRNAKAYGYDCAAQQALRDAAGQGGRAIAGDGADDHSQQAVAPDDLAIHDGDAEDDAVSQSGRNDFECVDLVQILVAEEREQE